MTYYHFNRSSKPNIHVIQKRIQKEREEMKHWQVKIATWVKTTFGPHNQSSTQIRSLRFIEEAIELVQVTGLQPAQIFQIVDKVYDKPVGKLKQEIGGTLVTLLALVENQGEVALDCLIAEVNRIHTPEAIKKAQLSEKKKQEARLI